MRWGSRVGLGSWEKSFLAPPRSVYQLSDSCSGSGAFACPLPRHWHRGRSGGELGSWANIYKTTGKPQRPVRIEVRCQCGGSQATSSGITTISVQRVWLECWPKDSATFSVEKEDLTSIRDNCAPRQSCRSGGVLWLVSLICWSISAGDSLIRIAPLVSKDVWSTNEGWFGGQLQS